MNFVFENSYYFLQCEIGGTLKRKATQASLSKEYDKFISTPFMLYEWAVKTIKMKFCYVSDAEYKSKESELKEMHKVLKTTTGTRSFHAFIPINKNK